MRAALLARFVPAALVATVAIAASCTQESPPAPAPTTPTPATPTPPAHAGPTWIDDDIDAALTTAKQAGKVVFVDGWAPWCHTCLSMQRDVLHDPALAKYADRVVFAAVDTDRPESASFVARFPMRAWPTFFVVDPATEQVLAAHGGSLSLTETTAFIDDALRARDPKAATEPATAALLSGHAAMGKKDYAAAAQHYAKAADLGGPTLAMASVATMRALSAAKDDAGCVAFGTKRAASFTTSSSSADFMGYLTSCAAKLPDGEARTAALQAARKALDQLTTTPPAGASVDDKADALAILADNAGLTKDTAAVKAAHEKRLKLLEDDANAQKSVEDARVHDYARMNSYVALGRGDDAVRMLTERTGQLPTSYEAWARLASALHQTKREDEAMVAAKKAVELSYGPRRLRYITLLADVCAARQDVACERATVQDLIDQASKLAPGHRDDAAIAAANDRLAKLGPAR